ncbi:hypothetical protein C5167_046314 [Papaver somniferum]|uniref:Uncharacterized protein n=1 Tax=Papaver somniferum TaxID=3469 RepID=A0A4Y7LG63_PAPSO|nr:hypothetical protein C5167_046314 [Papaver somniferum]
MSYCSEAAKRELHHPLRQKYMLKFWR